MPLSGSDVVHLEDATEKRSLFTSQSSERGGVVHFWVDEKTEAKKLKRLLNMFLLFINNLGILLLRLHGRGAVERLRLSGGSPL